MGRFIVEIKEAIHFCEGVVQIGSQGVANQRKGLKEVLFMLGL